MRSLNTLVWTLALSVAVLLTGFVAVVGLSPLPALEAVPTESFQTQHDSSTVEIEALVNAEIRPTAVGWAEIDGEWSNSEEAVPLASISKVISVLVTLEKAPLPENPDSWGELVITENDFLRQEEYRSYGGVAYYYPPGSALSLDNVFKLIFLPSDNGAVSAYVSSVFGSDAAFESAVGDWAERHNLPSLKMVEPSGMDSDNVANARDLVKIGRIALNHPIVSSYISTPTALVPGAGDVENTNPLFGSFEGAVGVKTGRTLDAGFNFLAAATDTVAERNLTRISVTLGRESLDDRQFSAERMLTALHTMDQDLLIFEEDETVAALKTWQGDTVQIVTSEGVSATLLPGEKVNIEVSLENNFLAGQAGDSAGHLTVHSPTGSETIEITLAGTIEEPDLLWRLKNPKKVFAP